MGRKKTKIVTAGVYRIDIGGRYYYGSSVDLTDRRREHLSLLKRGKHTNAYIQELFSKGHKLKYTIVETCHREYVKFVEQTYLDAHRGKPECLNIQPNAGQYLPTRLRQKTVWNGVTYGSRTEWALATGYSRGSYCKFVKKGAFSDEELTHTKAINLKNARTKYWTEEEKRRAKELHLANAKRKKAEMREQMINQSCKLAVYFNGRYWESIAELCRNTHHSKFAITKYLKLGAKCDFTLAQMMRESLRKGVGINKVTTPVVINFDGTEGLYPNYLTVAKAFGLKSSVKDEICKRLEWVGISIQPITKDEYYERQAKRAV